MWFSFFITWEQRKLGDVFLYERPDKYIVASDKYSDFYSTPVLTANKGFVLGYTNEKRTYNTPCVIFDDFTLDSKYVDFPFMVKSSALKILTTKQGYYLPFAYELLHAANIEVLGHARHYISVVQPTMVLVPSYSEQLRVGKFIEAIDNLITLHQRKQKDLFFLILSKKLSLILANDWEQRKVQDVAERYDNLRVPVAANLRVHGNIPYYGANGIQDYVDGFTHDGEFVLVAEDGANDLKNYPVQHVKGRIWVNNHAHVLQGKPNLMDNLFLAYSLHRADIASYLVGGSRAKLNADTLMTLELLLPGVEEQTKIGRLLDSIDNLITLHQCKENLVQSKYELHSLFQMQNKLADDWEQCKFEEYFEERNERSGEGELISVTINSGIKKFNELGRFDTKPEDLSKYKRVEVGDIAYNSMRMWQGASGYSPYSGILSPAYTVISPKTGVSSLFFAYLIKRPQMIHLFEINSQGLTSDTWNLKFPAFSQIEASAPTEIAEQKNIAEIFTVLDNLITLHQCKRAAFFDWKRWLYSKFEESKITLAWEQRKFESLAETRRGLTYNPSNISPHGIRVLRSSNINEDTFVLSDDDVFVCPDAVKIECVKPNDILITAANGSTRLVGKHAIIVGIRENEAVHGGFMLVASSSMPFFLNAAMSAPWYLKFINLFVAGGNGAIGNLNKNDLDNQLLFVPKNAEQEQIGEFFRNLDNLITLHQRGEKINNRRQT